MFPLSRFFAGWFCPPLKGSRWAIPLNARLCRGAPPCCAHRDGVHAESGTGRRVTFWHCKGENTELQQRPSRCGAPRPQASLLVSQPVCVFVRACSAAVPCCTGRLSIIVQRRAKRMGGILYLLQSCGCLSVSVPRLRGTNAAGPSATSPLHQPGCVCGFWCDVTSRGNGTVLFLFFFILLGSSWCCRSTDWDEQIRPRFSNSISSSVRRSLWISHLGTVVAVAVLVKMFHGCSFHTQKIYQQGYAKDALIVIFLQFECSHENTCGFQRISQNLNESAPLWRYVIGGHSTVRSHL